MKLNNFRVKERLTFDEFNKMCEILSGSVFEEDENGEIQYHPQMLPYAKIVAFFALCTEGVELDDDESYYDACFADEELQRAFIMTHGVGEISSQLKEIYNCTEQKIEFEKEKLIHRKKDSLSELLSTLNDKIKSFDMASFTPESLIAAYEQTDRYKGNTAEIIEAKNDLIRNLCPKR